jgi:polysaccharide export outer membrane protein
MKFSISFRIGAAASVALLYGTLCGQTPQTGTADSTTQGAAETAPSTAAAANKPHDNTFVIGDDDLLAISVWNEPNVSRSIPVRSDGKISLPLAGEVVAAGLTPLQLEQQISDKLKNYITDPQVTVIVQQINSQKYNILGQVTKPGAYPLTATTSIVDAIANAGGFKDFAKKKGIYILRRNAAGAESRIAFNYQDFIKGKNTSQNITLQPHDTIIVP